MTNPIKDWWYRKILARRVQWVRDLLSNKFKQGGGSLKRIGPGWFEYCCLGVACERVAPYARELGMRYGKSVGGYMIGKNARKFGLNREDQTTAALWNDSREFTFKRIADLVAYATDNNLRFDLVKPKEVPEGYAVSWLASLG